MRALGFDVKKAEVSKILQEHNKQGAGVMDFDDYYAVSMWRRAVAAAAAGERPSHAAWGRPVSAKVLERDPLEEMRKAFRLFDEDDKGRIDLRNLRRVARELGEDLTDEQLQSMIDEFDTDRDGQSTPAGAWGASGVTTLQSAECRAGVGGCACQSTRTSSWPS
jgi:centrin-3